MSRNSIIQSKNPFTKFDYSSYVDIKIVTWHKDSHGLFDYQSSNYEIEKFRFNEPTSFYFNEGKIRPSKEAESSSAENSSKILSIFKMGEEFFISQMDRVTEPSVIPFLIIRSLKCADGKTQRGYKIQMGDILKFGRAEFKVVEICTNNEIVNDDSNAYGITEKTFDADKQIVVDQKNVCRFCFSEFLTDKTEVENLLLFICNCKGSSAAVHYYCLMTWIQYKVISRTEAHMVFYHWKKMTCDLCLHPLPKSIIFKGKIYPLITVKKPNSPYLILETVSEHSRELPAINIFSTDNKKEFKIGRGHNCDLKIEDISVSRIHSILKYEQEKFFIFDNDSKFGTLVSLNNHLSVRSEKAAVQMGRTIFTFVKKEYPFEKVPFQVKN